MARRDPETGLNERQKRFCEEYVIDLNATQAAIRAGYSPKGADVTASKLLTNPKVAMCIATLQKELQERSKVTADQVVDEIRKLAFANALDYHTIREDGTMVVDLSNLTREQAAAIQETWVETYMEGKGDNAQEVKRVKIKLADKSKNLELLGRHFGIFNDKLSLGVDPTDTLLERRKRAGIADE